MESSAKELRAVKLHLVEVVSREVDAGESYAVDMYVLLCSYRAHHRTPRNGWSLVSPIFFFSPFFHGKALQ